MYFKQEEWNSFYDDYYSDYIDKFSALNSSMMEPNMSNPMSHAIMEDGHGEWRHGDQFRRNGSDLDAPLSFNESYSYYLLEAYYYRDPAKEAEHKKVLAIQSFISLTLVHIGLFITLLLTLERFIAVFFPLRAMSCLTTGKTRIISFIVLSLCILIHIPQLVIEIVSADKSVVINFKENFTKDTVIDPVRQHYRSFFAYSTLAICLFTFTFNVALLIKLFLMKRQLRGRKHIQKAEGNEINVSVAIAVLVFFQLPFHIFISVINELSYKFVKKNLDIVNQLLVASRLLNVFHVALNFVIYCVMAKNCRHVLRIIFCRMTRKRVSVKSLRTEYSAQTSSMRKHPDHIPLNGPVDGNGREAQNAV
ncbi:hypothetical protein FSP39_018625 [Pinctada imbricata]|uniref:G-protein coupled receptors family 1 profile domain-containing protein n=1 Tax=Pinctada imbricata TaxID=66713 RepID=A0AA89BV21_PINIB|nr:hypothetical protein FSP39_018625 [Pinctada imbricata]